MTGCARFAMAGSKCRPERKTTVDEFLPRNKYLAERTTLAHRLYWSAPDWITRILRLRKSRDL
jgi:hypothetical protein